MKKNFLVLVASLVAMFVNAQQKDKPTLDFYGFVRVDAYMDTYKGVDAGYDVFYLLPLYVEEDGIEDLNKQLSSNITAIASRLGTRIAFPDVLGAKATGLLEFDFAGNLKSDPTLFRIRQAYSLLSWEKSSLLIGQTWHPFFGNSCVPVVAGLNTGAPFSCFNRSPMVSYKMVFGEFTVSASAISEMQYTTPMVDQADFSYLLTTNHAKRDGVLPELVLSGEWTNKSVTLGGGAELKRIKPRLMITGTEGNSKSGQYLTSTAFMAYARYKTEKLTLLAKSFMGGNMSHMVMPGGYGVATYDEATGKETYTCYRTCNNSFNLVYGQKWQLGLFAGYGFNMGTKNALWDPGTGKAKTYGSFLNMQTMYRVAPHVSLNLKGFRLIAEYERTTANYGIGTINLSDGLFDSTHKATNNRIILVMSQYF